MTDHPLTDQQLTPAEIRLAQYGGPTSSGHTATYDSGTEKALHQIALGLKAEIDRLRAELAAATEFRLTPTQPAYTPLIVRRDPAYDGTGWAVLHDPGDVSVRRVWTAEGWEMAWASSHEEIYCWADITAALFQARRAQGDQEDREPDVDGVGRTPESYRAAAVPAAVETGE